MLPLVALVVMLSAVSQPQLVGPSQRPCLLKTQVLRGGGTLKPMRIASKTVDGVLNFDPLLIFYRGDGSLLRHAVAIVAYSAIANCVQGTAIGLCSLIVPMYWLLPFTLTMSMFVPVAITETPGTRLASPHVLLKRCRKLAAGQKRKIFWARVYGHVAAVCVASLVIMTPVLIAFKIMMHKHAEGMLGDERELTSMLAGVSAFVIYLMPPPLRLLMPLPLYAWLSTLYVDFLIYDELASHTPEQKESMA